MFRIDAANPVNWQSELNRGLIRWWRPIPYATPGGEKKSFFADITETAKIDPQFNTTYGSGVPVYGLQAGAAFASVDCGLDVQFDWSDDGKDDTSGFEAAVTVICKKRSNSPANKAQAPPFDSRSVTGQISHYPFTADGKIYLNTFRHARVTVGDNSSFNKAEWHMFSVSTCDFTHDGRWRFFQNGKQFGADADGVAPYLTQSNTYHRTIGGQDNTTYQNFDGWIADIRLFNRWISPEEMLDQFHAYLEGYKRQLNTLPRRTTHFWTTISGSGSSGSITDTLPKPTDAATGGTVSQGPIADTLPAFTDAASGGTVASGAATDSLPSMTDAATGDLPIEGGITDTLPSLSDLASGGTVAEGQATDTLPSVSDSASGGTTTSGDITETLPKLTDSATGTQGDVASGSISDTLPSMSDAASGGSTVEGPITDALPSMADAASGGTIAEGAATDTLPSMSDAASGGTVAEGPIVDTLPSFTDAASGGTVSQGGITDTLPSLIDALTDVPEDTYATVLLDDPRIAVSTIKDLTLVPGG